MILKYWLKNLMFQKMLFSLFYFFISKVSLFPKLSSKVRITLFIESLIQNCFFHKIFFIFILFKSGQIFGSILISFRLFQKLFKYKLFNVAQEYVQLNL